MKRIIGTIFIIIVLLTTFSLSGCNKDEDKYENLDNVSSATISIKQAGALSSLISEEEASKIKRLKLKGYMDARDFDYIKWHCLKIENVNLSEVTINEYSGIDGTNEGYYDTYHENEIPLGAFFYWKKAKYNYMGVPSDEGMPSLKEIILPKGIRAIRRNAFARAYNLIKINIPEGVEEIDYVAFCLCTSLEEIDLPSTLKNIGKLAFANMSKLNELSIAATIPPEAEDDTFLGIPENATLYVPKETKYLYEKARGWNVFKKIIEQ